MWFQVLDFDEEGKKNLKLKGKDGNTFASHVEGTVPRNYMVVLMPEGATAPSDEVIKAVHKLTTAPLATPSAEESVAEVQKSKSAKGGTALPPKATGQKRPVKKKAVPTSKSKGKSMAEQKAPANKPAKKKAGKKK
jgi:hypothetical protein